MYSGFRTVRVIEGVTSGDFTDLHGNVKIVEVTNGGGADTHFYPNVFPDQGHPKADVGIPIKAGTTRVIPMSVYNFVADTVVTVVVYAM